MGLEDLIKNNQAAVLALFSAILGMFVAQAGNLISKQLDHQNNLKIKRLDMAIELEKKYLIEPVVAFIDRELELMQKSYAKMFDAKDSNASFTIDNTHIFELSAVQARVKGLGDIYLNKKFEEFSRARISVGTAATDSETRNAYAQLDKAISLAGEILELLFKKLKKIDH